MNAKLRISAATRRDFEHIKAAWAEFMAEMRDPWTAWLLIVCSFVLAAMLLLPWLMEPSDF